MIFRLATLSLCSLAFTQDLRADEFYFGSAETAAKMAEGSTPDMIRGVLLRRENGNLVIRVEGGEITVPGSRVYKIVQDDLSEAEIVDMEIASRAQLAEANEIRMEWQAAEAAERLERLREARAREAVEDAEHAEAALHPTHLGQYGYDPIIHRSTGPILDYVLVDYIRQELGGHIRRAIHEIARRLRHHY